MPKIGKESDKEKKWNDLYNAPNGPLSKMETAETPSQKTSAKMAEMKFLGKMRKDMKDYSYKGDAKKAAIGKVRNAPKPKPKATEKPLPKGGWEGLSGLSDAEKRKMYKDMGVEGY